MRLGAAIQRAFEGDDVEPIQLEMHAGNRRTVVIEGSFHLPRHTVAADDRRLVVRLRDVSEREQQSRALDQARRRFQQAFQSAPTGMALVRVDDGRIVDANQSLAEMLRRDVDELVGCTLREFTHPDDVRAAAAAPGAARARHRRLVPHRPALPAPRRRVRVGPHPRVGRRGRRRDARDHPHRGRHRAAPRRRAAALRGPPRRAHRACRTART